MIAARLTSCIGAALGTFLASGAEIQIKWSDRVEVTGLASTALQTLAATNWTSAQWEQLLSVRAEQGNILTDLNLPAMVGSYTIRSNAVQFTPSFPFEPGINYRATFRPEFISGAGEPISSAHKIPPPVLDPTTVVAAIHPAADILPENILKFYIQFSAPMSGGHIYDHITLLDAAGKPVQLPFLEIDEELWNRDMTRLTLFLDPGRIKRGVRPLTEIGPAIQAGKSFTLVINKEWRDAKGTPLKSDFEKKFKVVPPDRDPPDPAKWKIAAPKSKNAPLKITFNEPLDHALAQRILKVSDPTGFTISGKVELDAADREWTFTPDQPWKAGAHQILIPTIIEDLAGNNIGKPFDVDLQQSPRPMTNSMVRLPVVVK